jgi:hypothetical protein
VEMNAVWFGRGIWSMCVLVLPSNTSYAFKLHSQATIFQPNPPPKAHNKCITWTEQNPVEAGEMITASADGDVKVWRYPSLESGT